MTRRQAIHRVPDQAGQIVDVADVTDCPVCRAAYAWRYVTKLFAQYHHAGRDKPCRITYPARRISA